MEFYVGLHQPSNAQHFDQCMVSVNRLRDRRSDIPARVWMLDSGAFTEIATHGGYRDQPEVYARQVVALVEMRPARRSRLVRIICASHSSWHARAWTWQRTSD
jgi:hypothetical protein